MKKCPFCAEEIQNEAIKCKHCGEWLKEVPIVAASESPVTASDKGPTSPKKPINACIWKETSFIRVALMIVLLPAVIILLDVIIRITFFKLSGEITESGMHAIAYIFYCVLGVWFAQCIYKLQKLIPIIVLSFITLFLYRLLFSAIIGHEFVSQAMINTLKEGITIYAVLTLFVFIFRYFESRIDYAEAREVFEFTDPMTKKKYDRGTCTKCGGLTIVGKETAIRFLGKSTEYFCANCGRFLQGNPLNNIFLGITEAASALLFMIGASYNIAGAKWQPYWSIFFLVLLVGIGDGIKRSFFGISGVRQSFKKYKPL